MCLRLINVVVVCVCTQFFFFSKRVKSLAVCPPTPRTVRSATVYLCTQVRARLIHKFIIYTRYCIYTVHVPRVTFDLPPPTIWPRYDDEYALA